MTEEGRLDALVDQACALRLAYFALGNHLAADPQGWFVTDPSRPLLYDSNHLRGPRAGTAAEVDGLLARVERHLGGLDHRVVVCDPHTPPVFEARLLADGYEPADEVQLVLSGPPEAVVTTPEGLRIREVSGEDDWELLGAMRRRGFIERATREGVEPYPDEVATGLVEVGRAKARPGGEAPPLRWWIAELDGRPAAHLASLVGEHGLGMLEHLYTEPELRGRGVAGALLCRVTAVLREAGCHTVLIGARPGLIGARPGLIGARSGDGSVRLYRRLGFEPLYVERRFVLRATSADPDPGHTAGVSGG